MIMAPVGGTVSSAAKYESSTSHSHLFKLGFVVIFFSTLISVNCQAFEREPTDDAALSAILSDEDQAETIDATQIPTQTSDHIAAQTKLPDKLLRDSFLDDRDDERTVATFIRMIVTFTWRIWRFTQDTVSRIFRELNELDLMTPNVTTHNVTEDLGPAERVTSKLKQINCDARNSTDKESQVLLLNSTMLQSRLSKRDNVTGHCAVVMFYASWCLFCARSAPHYNALGRAFPQMDVLAIDAVHFSSWNVRYGTIAVPNIIVFYNGRQISRFNGTERTFTHLVQYVSNITGFQPLENISIAESDYIGPIPSQPTNTTDYLLIAAWAFVAIGVLTLSLKSNKFQQIHTRMQILWREHQHLD